MSLSWTQNNDLNRTTNTDIITPTVLLIPTSTPPFSSATLNMATSYVPQSSRVPLQQSSPASEVSSPSLPHPHVTVSSTRGGYMAETMPISLCWFVEASTKNDTFLYSLFIRNLAFHSNILQYSENLTRSCFLLALSLHRLTTLKFSSHHRFCQQNLL